MGAGPPRSIFVRRIMSKQRQLTAWLKPREGEPPAKRGRQDTDSDAEAASGPSPLLSSFSDPLTMSCLNFDPRKLSLSSDTRSPLQSCSKPGRIAEFACGLNRKDMFSVVYKPPPNYAFLQHTEGQGSHKRLFQLKWLNEHAWLAYSREKDGGYCVPCVFFCKDPEGLGKLV